MKRVVVVHLHYLEIWQELVQFIKNIKPDEVHVTTTHFSDAREMVLMDFPNALLYRLENRGRDIYPLIYLAKKGIFEEQSVVWKFHSKRSLHTLGGDKWRRELIIAIAEDHDVANEVYEMIAERHTSLVGSQKYLKTLSQVNYLDHQSLFKLWSVQTGILIEGSRANYIAGTIFACSSEILRPLEKISIYPHSFILESNQKPFSKWFAIRLSLFHKISKLKVINRKLLKMDRSTRPATKETYALEAFFGFLAQNFRGVKGR